MCFCCCCFDGLWTNAIVFVSEQSKQCPKNARSFLFQIFRIFPFLLVLGLTSTHQYCGKPSSRHSKTKKKNEKDFICCLFSTFFTVCRYSRQFDILFVFLSSHCQCESLSFNVIARLCMFWVCNVHRHFGNKTHHCISIIKCTALLGYIVVANSVHFKEREN